MIKATETIKGTITTTYMMDTQEMTVIAQTTMAITPITTMIKEDQLILKAAVKEADTMTITAAVVIITDLHATIRTVVANNSILLNRGTKTDVPLMANKEIIIRAVMVEGIKEMRVPNKEADTDTIIGINSLPIIRMPVRIKVIIKTNNNLSTSNVLINNRITNSKVINNNRLMAPITPTTPILIRIINKVVVAVEVSTIGLHKILHGDVTCNGIKIKLDPILLNHNLEEVGTVLERMATITIAMVDFNLIE